MENKRLLLAEDDVNLGKVLNDTLTAKGFNVKYANNGEMAYELFTTSDFDICLIDVMMPLKDGFTLVKEIRKLDKKVPIIFLTAKTLPQDMVEGLRIGADDYITKPFDTEVLMARIEAQLRHSNNDAEKHQTVFQLGAITFDANRQILIINDKEKKLTTRENEVLLMLIQNKNDVLERGYALKKIWGDDSFYNARSMDVYITKLRRYFKDDPSVQIVNIHGVGFKLVI
ncbi:MAG: response regulator transcription factor [Bacteroidales bacterium]|nr:response regulator transcription factor [Bacteroidales bacterium]